MNSFNAVRLVRCLFFLLKVLISVAVALSVISVSWVKITLIFVVGQVML